MTLFEIFRPFATAIFYKHGVQKEYERKLSKKYPDLSRDSIWYLAKLETEKALSIAPELKAIDRTVTRAITKPGEVVTDALGGCLIAIGIVLAVLLSPFAIFLIVKGVSALIHFAPKLIQFVRSLL